MKRVINIEIPSSITNEMLRQIDEDKKIPLNEEDNYGQEDNNK